MQAQQEGKMKNNVMRTLKIEKIVLNIGGTADKVDKSVRLLNKITNRKPVKMKAKMRIPSLGVRPGLEIGSMVTIRKGIEELLKRLLAAKENKLKRKNVAENHFSFGIKEYIEIPGVEYQRDIGVMGLDVTVVFVRSGRRVVLRKLRKSHVPKRQYVTKEEIIKFMEEKFKTEFIGK